MIINVDIDDNILDLINKGYQHESMGNTAEACVSAMRDAVDKLAKDLKVCDHCNKVFKQIYKTQCFCSTRCSEDFENRKQPILPFDETKKE